MCNKNFNVWDTGNHTYIHYTHADLAIHCYIVTEDQLEGV